LRIDGLVLALTDGRTATERAAALGEAVVLFDLALDYASCGRIAIASAAQASAADVFKAAGLFGALGKRVSQLADVPGMLVMRTVAMLVNEGAEAVYQGIASADSVDAAMRKGVNYPIGPMAWGRDIGLATVLRTVRNLGASYGEDRYRGSVWLQREVQAAS
jgi:3-hydroxybutyryl-CoA dehydrogenase